MKNITKKLAAAAVLLLLLAVFLWWQNNGLTVSEYDYTLPPGQEGLDGVRIAQISDLHNKDFDGRLEAQLEKARPDLVVLTGDLIDKRREGDRAALALAGYAAGLAPTFYVPGNHEGTLSWSGDYAAFREQLKRAGVRVLEDEAEGIKLNGGTVRLIGLLDPVFYDAGFAGAAELMAQRLEGLTGEEELNVLLSHRPSLVQMYAAKGADLVFSGHAHGGQIRLPIVGGLFAPDEGFWPKYTAGLYQVGDAAMAVSRGLGNSVIPLRLFNRPELVVVTLRAQ